MIVIGLFLAFAVQHVVISTSAYNRGYEDARVEFEDESK